MNIPQEVKISEKHTKLLRDLQQKQESIRKFVQMMIDQGERQITAFDEQRRTIWKGIALEYGIDVDNVSWDLHNVEPKIIPTMMNLKKSTLSN